MFAPSVLESAGAAGDSDHLFGGLIVMFAVIATTEVVRSLRYINVLLAAWVAIAAWFLDGGTVAARWNDVITGALLILLSLPRGIVRERYGSWDRLVR